MNAVEPTRIASCVEAGVDFSFRTAFRDLFERLAQAGSWGLVNLLQITSRASRSGCRIPTGFWPKAQGCEVRATLDCRSKSRVNPNGVAIRGAVGHNPVGVSVVLDDIPRVARASQPCAARRNPFGIGSIIDDAAQSVVVEPGLIQRLENPDRSQWPGWRELMLGSVQLWANRLDAGKLPVKPLGHDGELWAWIGEYNPFLGYMAGVLPLLKAGKTGFEPL